MEVTLAATKVQVLRGSVRLEVRAMRLEGGGAQRDAPATGIEEITGIEEKNPALVRKVHLQEGTGRALWTGTQSLEVMELLSSS